MAGRPKDIARAQQTARDARARLIGTMRELQARVTPSALMADAAREVREQGGKLADGALAFAGRRPIATASILALVVAFLGRKMLFSAIGRLFFGGDETETTRRRFDTANPGASDAPDDQETVR